MNETTDTENSRCPSWSAGGALLGADARPGQCRSAMQERDYCRDGFPQRASCWGIRAGVPACCDEHYCGTVLDQFGGKPPAHFLPPNR